MVWMILFFPFILIFLSWYIKQANRISDKLSGRSEFESQLLDDPINAINDAQRAALSLLNKHAEGITERFFQLYTDSSKAMPRANRSEILMIIAHKIFKTPDNMPTIIQNEFGICYMWALSEGLRDWDNHRVLQTFAMIDGYLIRRGFPRQQESTRHSIIKAIGVPVQHIKTADHYST